MIKNVATAIRGIVDGAAAKLAPYRQRLASLGDFIGAIRNGSKAKLAARAAAKLSDGQKVIYAHGRGRVKAKVVQIDLKKGLVTLERVGDRKRVVRPAAKVRAA
jgi:hypothetical protein